MKSYRTTIAGIATILVAVGSAVKLALAGQYGEAFSVASVGITSGVGLIAARDNKVSSEEAGAK